MNIPITRRSLLSSAIATLGVSQLPPIPAKEFVFGGYTIWNDQIEVETLSNFEWMRSPLSERGGVAMVLIGIDVMLPGEPKKDRDANENDKEQRDDGKR